MSDPSDSLGTDEVQRLISRFGSDQDYFRSDDFKEMGLRSEFLNPILRLLGWDPDNPGLRGLDREVVQDPALTIDGRDKAPDYAMLLARRRRFFLEAKRPSVNIEAGRASAYQIRRYSWNAGLPLGIVTDFEEWAVYDCRHEPKPDDSATVGRIKYFKFDQLPEMWDWLVETFGRESVAKGSLDAYAVEHPIPRGTLTVDQSFLEEIREWRRRLAADIHDHNPSLTALELNSSVQNLIDRIIFLRIAEARGLEPFGEMQDAMGSSDPYMALMGLFRRADNRYNSGLFHFSHEGGHVEPPDTIGPGLQVSPEVLRYVVTRLYFPHPYEFSAMPADILGRVYEQFLGEEIILRDGRALVEEKPEVRRAGGVYYTPEPIVNYIVETTVGPLLEGSTPAKVAGVKVVDPSCGSGSFLIAAYQYIIDWHVDYYTPRRNLARKHLESTLDGGLRLKTSERRRILLDNIFGVDIDRQAVEVTKLSLLLKLIEGQVQSEFELGRLLPDLDKNIRCGNSLIDIDFEMPLEPTDREQTDLNPFSWSENFPEIFRQGGFDAVIGNPPYLNIDSVWGRRDPRLRYIKDTYPSIHTDKTDILFYFLAKATQIGKGEIGYIVSRSFLEADKAQKLRKWLGENTRVREVLDFRHAMVFPRVGINTAIVRLTGSTAPSHAEFRRLHERSLPPGYDTDYLRNPDNTQSTLVPQARIAETVWNFGNDDITDLLERIDAAGTPVGEILVVGQGMQTGSNNAFQVPSASSTEDFTNAHCVVYRRARNSDIRPFEIRSEGPRVMYVEDSDSFTALPAAARQQLETHKQALEGRAAFKRGNCKWWRYTWPLHRELMHNKRILVPYRASSNRFAVDDSCSYLGLTDTTVLYDNEQAEDLRYIAAVLNSDALTFRFRYIGKLVGGGTYEYFHNTVSKLPVPRREPGDPDHDALVDLTRRLETAAIGKTSSIVPAEKRQFEADYSVALEELNRIVNRLIGLSEEDVALIREQLDESNAATQDDGGVGGEFDE